MVWSAISEYVVQMSLATFFFESTSCQKGGKRLRQSGGLAVLQRLVRQFWGTRPQLWTTDIYCSFSFCRRYVKRPRVCITLETRNEVECATHRNPSPSASPCSNAEVGFLQPISLCSLSLRKGRATRRKQGEDRAVQKRHNSYDSTTLTSLFCNLE